MEKKENNKDGMKFLKCLLSMFLFLGINAQTEKNVDIKSLVWARYYNQLELNKNGLFILKLIIGFS
jgi:hypothetical protein